jgi:hypothetical protein
MVLVNGKILGFTAGKTYFRVNVQPGTYSITSKVVDHSKPSIVTLNVDSGKNYFIWQEVYSNGFSHETRLHQVNEEEGRKGVLESQLIANTISDREISLDVSNNDKTSSVSKKLRELQSLRNDNVITADEYEIKRKQLMNEL